MSRMESFSTIANGFQALTVVTKLVILDVCKGPGYACLTPPRSNLFLATKSLTHFRPVLRFI